MNLSSPKLQQMIQQEMNPGEQLIWSGQPRPFRLAKRAIPLMLFGIPFGGFALFWIAGASGFKIPDFSEGGFSFFPLFGLPFFLIGLGMVLSPVWEAIKARSTVYVITTMRAIIFEPSIFGGMDITSFRADDLADISRTQRTDGSGDLVFAREVSHGRNGTRVKEIGFLGIPRVKAVEDMLRALRGESVR